MEITITRHLHTPWSVDGTMEIKGLSVCETVEHPEKHLPVGKYEINYVTNKAFGKKMPMIKVAKKTASVCKLSASRRAKVTQPCIMPGNGPFLNTDGSIIVGEHLFAGLLGNTSMYFERLYQRVKKCDRRKESITLIIREQE